MEIHFLGLLFGLVMFFVTSEAAFPSVKPHARAAIDPNSSPLSPNYGMQTLNRTSFPKGFVFGSGTSAYQVEGAWNEDGKGPSIWDTFTHTFPEKLKDGSNGDVATDSYHRYKEDVRIIKTMNQDAHRFSIAWSRVLPRGKLSKGVNEEGIKYYNNFINELLSQGITPYVTLFHWDLPQALEDEYDGFLSPQIIDDFRNYAELCFERFGDRVKHWTTVNEPWSFSKGYAIGDHAPGRCSSWVSPSCPKGNSATEPYLAMHYQLLAHAAAVKSYRLKYQASQKGKIGITLVTAWMLPYSHSKLDRRAVIRALDFMLGWCLEPLTSGDYPRVMRSMVGNRLPEFTSEQSKMLIGSFDFLGINYYTSFYVAHVSSPQTVNVSYTTDSQAALRADRNGTLIGEQAGSTWLHVYPRGLYEVLVYIKRRYNNSQPIYITENGIDEMNNSTLPVKQALVDNFRIKYFNLHLSYIHQAIKLGVNVIGYFSWSALDNFEFTAGYISRFGLNYVDYEDGLKRYPKLSAQWFANFLKK